MIAVGFRFIAVTAARQIDKDGPTGTELRVADYTGIFIRRGAAETVDKNQWLAVAGKFLPAHRAMGLLRIKAVHKYSFSDDCVFIQATEEECYCWNLNLEGVFRNRCLMALRLSGLRSVQQVKWVL
ncbi:hypothetical protein D3C76_1059380 [compost metagenome]